MYQYLFGPVPSRRLGWSLGVDLVTHKICSFDCIYCECGSTTELTAERKAYVPYDAVTKELDHFWQYHEDPDYITFSGSGEPTLNVHIGSIIDYIKENKPGIQVAVLTNGSLLYQTKVRKELLRADLVIPSLDAVTESAYMKMNRPCSLLKLERVIQGLEVFSKEYQGWLVLEVFILPGVNDTTDDILALKDVIQRLQPDQLQLNTLDRPGTLRDISPASIEELEQVKNRLGYENTEIIASGRQRKPILQKKEDPKQNLKDRILETIHRRPCTAEDLIGITSGKPKAVKDCLENLVLEGKIESKNQERGTFFYTRK